MKKIKSRKGMTLIELVVTVAILSIVGGMSIGIFSSTMNHYSTASITANEQNNTTTLENYIISNAKVAKDIKFIPDPVTSSADVPGTTAGTYIAKRTSDEKFIVIENYDPTKTDNVVVSLEGIESVTIMLKRHIVGSAETDEDFMYLDYEIKMERGYSLKGSVVMNNMPLKSLSDGSAPISYDPPVTIKSSTTNTGILFVK